MNVNKRKAGVLALVMCVVLLVSGCGSAVSGTSVAQPVSSENSAVEMELVAPPEPELAAAVRPLRPVTTTVTLSDAGIEVEGNGAQAEGGILTITADGVYEISGSLSDGQIIVNAPEAAVVELLLSGVDITSSQNAAIYCANADDLIISLASGSENTLTDAQSYTYADEVNQEPDAALFSKVDMNIGGAGSLIVNGNFNHGINGNDLIQIVRGNVERAVARLKL